MPARTGDGPVVLSCGEANGRTLPPVGVLLDSDGHLFDDREAALLRALALPHLHAEVLAEEPGGARAIAHAGAAAEAIGAPLALALVFPPGVADIAPLLSSLKPAIDSVRLARLMLLPEGEAVTPDAWLAEGQRVFGGGLPLAIGTRGDFVALNRVRPQPPEGVGLVYAVNPQVHDSDIDALVQSPEGQADAVRTALSFAPGAPLHVGPLTLKPRPLSLAAAGDAAPADADSRQATCLAAAWLASSVKHLAEAGAASVTAFEATGRRGVVGRVADMAVHGPSWSEYGVPFPAFHVLAALSRYRGAPLIDCRSNDASCQGLAMEAGHGVALMAWSFAPVARRLRVIGLAAGEWRIWALTPGGWEDSGVILTEAGEIDVPLGPYAVLSVEKANVPLR